MQISITSSAILLSMALSQVAATPAPISNTLSNLLGGKKQTTAPKEFTSAFFVRAEPGQVISSSNQPAPGETGALGRFSYYLNSNEEKICYDLELEGVTGDYESPADTATHIHQAAKGVSGPPRIAFPNPERVSDRNGKEIRRSAGCLKGPFTTGIPGPNGVDTGSDSGFTLSQIEADPAAFFGDTHTANFVPGAVRGQLVESEREVKAPKKFTSILKTEATNSQIVANDGSRPAGKPDGRGTFELKINSEDDILCYKIVTFGVDGTYFSPAKTATHVHQANFGSAGPPRLAFKNPQQSKIGKLFRSKKRTSEACIQGPFTTGLNSAAGIDTGSASGFSLKALEANPEGFFADTHTFDFPAGAIRGNLYRAK